MKVLDNRKFQEIFRENPELLEELRNHFNPKPEIVKTLPNPREVQDFKVVNIKQTDGTYIEHKMLNGAWVKTNGSAVANGTYTVGIGTSTNGTITITNGIITAIQQAT